MSTNRRLHVSMVESKIGADSKGNPKTLCTALILVGPPYNFKESLALDKLAKSLSKASKDYDLNLVEHQLHAFATQCYALRAMGGITPEEFEAIIAKIFVGVNLTSKWITSIADVGDNPVMEMLYQRIIGLK